MDLEDDDEPKGPALLRAPVTSLLALSWVALFVLLAITRARAGPINVWGALYGGFIVTDISGVFGDVTPIALYGGQSWRAVTATFVHFNVLHLALNLVAFVQLGRVVESWYGPWQFLTLYAVLGAGANFASNLLRPWIDGAPGMIVHSGGGSTVVLGLIGLVAVVGWRNPAEFPKRAPYWMLGILVANGVLGAVVPNIDNLGHACGAVVGGLLGLLDRRLLRRANSRRAKLAGVIALGVLVGSAWMQAGQARAELDAATREGRWGAVVQRLSQVSFFYRQLAARGISPALRIAPRPPNLLGLPILEIPEDPKVIPALRLALLASIRQLDALPQPFDRPPFVEAYREVRRLGSRALFKAPTREELQRFEGALPRLSRPAWASWARARQDRSRMRHPEPRFGGERIRRLVRRSGPPRAGAGAFPSATSTP
ncbi:rhomboid family intramembrane serine protease [Tautonia plasticadhaerens]|uniref:Rhomboid protease GluP n=1 Tax=Tautonia plasticadhaerens TaxID=2527974 RepID=A0A518H8T1_9BACT|nr:rhomboid family intramembrane serine protease [Tautonia plasticadhaerens]QDV37257.1 Rhomboid protease GluP [Tautonia plasticadhaerens]